MYEQLKDFEYFVIDCELKISLVCWLHIVFYLFMLIYCIFGFTVSCLLISKFFFSLFPFVSLLFFFPSSLHHFSALLILQLSLLYFSDRGFLIRLESSKDSDRGKDKDKDKDKEKDKDKDKDRDKYKDLSNPSVFYSHSALPVSSEAISLFRFLLRTDDWKALVEQTLLRPLLDMTDRIRTFQVCTYKFHHFVDLSL